MENRITLTDELFDSLEAVAGRSVRGVFSSYNLRLGELTRAAHGAGTIAAAARDAAVQPPTVGAVVAFSGPKLRGELLLAASIEVVAATTPAGASSAASSAAVRQLQVRDWMAELANQVLGHVGNRLSGPDAAFTAGAPIPLSGRAIELMTPKSRATRPAFFRAPNGSVWFWFDVLADKDLEIAAAVEAPEGELIRF